MLLGDGVQQQVMSARCGRVSCGLYRIRRADLACTPGNAAPPLPSQESVGLLGGCDLHFKQSSSVLDQEGRLRSGLGKTGQDQERPGQDRAGRHTWARLMKVIVARPNPSRHSSTSPRQIPRPEISTQENNTTTASRAAQQTLLAEKWSFYSGSRGERTNTGRSGEFK